MKGLVFLVVGVAVGFVGAAFLYRRDHDIKKDANRLADDIEKRFGRLEVESAVN